MKIDFYYMPLSAPCRSVLLTAKALDVELNCKLTNLLSGEHMTPEYIAMNPQHTIPTMDDNGFHLWESRAIMTYLMNKYGKDDSLYPKDPKARAIVEQRLYFDMGTLYHRFGEYVYPVMWGKDTSLDPEKKKKLEEALGWLDGFIHKSGGYCAGKHVTLADFAIIASIATIEAAGVVELAQYKHLSEWFAKCKGEMKGYAELNHDGAVQFGEWAKSKLTGK